MSTFDIARVDNPSRHFGSATGDSIYSRTETVVSRSTPKATPSRVPPQSFPSDAQSDLAESCAQLVTERTFEALMDDAIARFKFRDYLMVSGGDLADFDLWTDLRAYGEMASKMRMVTFAVKAAVLETSGDPHMSSTILRSLEGGVLVGKSLCAPQRDLLQRLFANEFQHYVRFRLVEDASARLGHSILTEADNHGIGDAFVLTDPHRPDGPIVFVSRGFEHVTGYPADEIIGFNCRFLQGRATAPESVARIRTTVAAGEGSTTVLLNYKRDGTPFQNLLSIIPLYGLDGSITHFVGGTAVVTTDLTRLIATERTSTAPEVSRTTFSPLTNSLFEDLNPGLSLTTTSSRLRLARQSTAEERSMMGLTDLEASLPETENPLGTAKRAGGRAAFKRIFLSKSKATLPKIERFNSDESLIDDARSCKSLDHLVSDFESVYRCVIVFNLSRKIEFVSARMLEFLGLPSQAHLDVCQSHLISTDILDVLNLSKTEIKSIKDAIGAGNALAVDVRLRSTGASSRLHLTPMRGGGKAPIGKESDSHPVEAYIAIFG